MQLTTLAFSGLAVSASAQVATFFVDNKCNFDLWLQSSHDSAVTSPIRLPAGKIDAFSTPIGTSSTRQSAVTVSRQPNLSSPLQALYNVGTNPSRTYYDLSTIFGDPLMGQGFQLLAGSASNGYSIVCPPRTSGDCPNTYNPDNKSGVNAVFNQGTNANLILQLCSSTGTPN